MVRLPLSPHFPSDIWVLHSVQPTVICATCIYLQIGIPGFKSLAFHWFFVGVFICGAHPSACEASKCRIRSGCSPLAKHDLAPTLHAYSEVEGSPRAYIMEYLDPSALVWCFTTSRFCSLNPILDRKSLQKNGTVHAVPQYHGQCLTHW